MQMLSASSISIHPVVVLASPDESSWFLGAVNDDGTLLSRESGDFYTYEAAAAALGSAA